MKKENADLIREALKLCGREDLIGFGKDCLVAPAVKRHYPDRGSEKTANRKRAPGKDQKHGDKKKNTKQRADISKNNRTKNVNKKILKKGMK